MRDVGNGAIVLGNAINLDHPLNRGLRGHWLALPGLVGGSTLRNIVSPISTGTLKNAPTWSSAAGRRGGYGSLACDGVNDYVECMNSKKFTVGATGITAAIWLKTTTTASVVAFGSYGGTTKTGFALQINRGSANPDAGKIYAFWRGDANPVNSRYTTSDTNVNDGNWHHVVIATDYSATSTDASIYLDGQSQSVTAVATNNLTPVELLYNVFIGAQNNVGTASDFFPGALDDARFYSRKLTWYEIWQLYNESRRGYPTMLNRLSPLRTFYFGYAPPSVESSYSRRRLRSSLSGR